MHTDQVTERLSNRRNAGRDVALVGVSVTLMTIALTALALGSENAAVTWAVAGGLSLVLVGLGAMASLRSFRGLDEAEREASSTAWMCGGGAGLIIGGAAMLIGSSPLGAQIEIPPIFTRTDPAVYMALGAILLTTLMLVGYTLARWLWWRERL